MKKFLKLATSGDKASGSKYGESHVTLRHGSNNVVYGNDFLDGAGIRIKEGQTQIVCNLTGNEVFINNLVQTGMYLPTSAGFSQTSIATELNENGYFLPLKHLSPEHEVENLTLYNIPELDDDKQIKLDIMGNMRPVSESKKDQGCFQAEGKIQLHPYAGATNTGPAYLL